MFSKNLLLFIVLDSKNYKILVKFSIELIFYFKIVNYIYIMIFEYLLKFSLFSKEVSPKNSLEC